MASPKHIDPSTIPFTPIPPPPNPNAICRISFLLNGMMRTNRRVFVDQKQDEMIDVPAWGFLIEKETEDGVHMIVWDLGCRKDPENFPPDIRTRALPVFPFVQKEDVTDRLAEGNLKPSDVNTVMLSHIHMDHIGNPLVMPASTKFVVGSMEPLGRGYPADPDSSVNEEEIKGHEWTELLKDPTREWKPVATFDRSLDWFGDGSFYLLDAPGHVLGHIAAMVRTTADPPTYMVLAGDAAHDLCLYHLADGLSRDSRCSFGMWGPKFALDAPEPERLYCMHVNPQESYRTIARLSRLDEEANVFVTVAHENELLKIVPTFPANANDWKAKGWKDQRKAAARERVKAHVP